MIKTILSALFLKCPCSYVSIENENNNRGFKVICKIAQ